MNKIFRKFSTVFEYYKQLIGLISLISNIKKLYIIFFFVVLIISAFFEITLLGFLFILIKAFMDPSYYQGNFFFKFLLEIFNIKTNSELIFTLSSFFILACIASGIFRLSFFKIVAHYVAFIGKNITSMCYQRIVYQDYKNLFNNNVNDSLSIFQKMPIVVNSLYNSLIMIYNLITFIFIFGILAYINFNITVISTIFFVLIYLFVILIFKRKIFINATTVSNEQSTNIKIVRETFNGFRDILINNYQNFYNNIFFKSYSKLIKGQESNRFFFFLRLDL